MKKQLLDLEAIKRRMAALDDFADVPMSPKDVQAVLNDVPALIAEVERLRIETACEEAEAKNESLRAELREIVKRARYLMQHGWAILPKSMHLKAVQTWLDETRWAE